MDARRFLVLLVLVLGFAGCGGGGPQSTVDRLESSFHASLSDVLGGRGVDVRNVRCVGFRGQLGICTADIPIGPDVFRDRYVVRLRPDGCWQARQTAFGRLVGRDTDALGRVRRLDGCFGG